MYNKDENNYVEEYEDDKEEKRLIILKRLGIVFLVIIGIIFIMLLLKGCLNNNKNKYENSTTLLEGAKEYYENNNHLLPKNIGECSTITLKDLSEKGIIYIEKFDGCDVEKTYVKVCMLESKKLQWTPMKLCGNEDTESQMNDFTLGTENNLIKDQSDVSFKYLGQYLDLSNSSLGDEEEYWKDEIPYASYKTLSLVNYYRYRDLEYLWNIITKFYYTSAGEKTSASNVTEYYVNSPESKYTNKDSANKSASKWYIGESRDYYMVNGIKKSASESDFEYKSTYPNKELATVLSAYRTKSVWTEVSKPTKYSAVHYYYCKKSASDNTGILSFQPCRNQLNDNPLYSYQVEDFYSCEGTLTNKVSANTPCYRCTTGSIKEDNSSCGSYSWSNWNTTKCDTSLSTCEEKKLNLYYWYKSSNEVRSYYPSGSANASGEKVYYISSPIKGAVKDETTTTTAYKWYRSITSQTNKYYSTSPGTGATKTDTKRYTDWSDWTTSKPKELISGTRQIENKVKVKLQQILSSSTQTWKDASKEYLSEDEMITSLQNAGFKVNSLSEINSSGEVQYKTQLYYRNKEEK